MIRYLLLGLACMATTVGRTSSSFAQAPTAAASARVASLLSRMTLDEKIGQMTQINISVITSAKQARGRIALDSAKLKEAIVRRHVGSIINVLDGAIAAAEWQRVITKITFGEGGSQLVQYLRE